MIGKSREIHISKIAQYFTAAAVILLVFTTFAAPVFADENLSVNTTNKTQSIIYTDNNSYGFYDISGFSVANTYTEDELNTGLNQPQNPSKPLPASYDLRDLGLVTSVKNQGDFETCWAFSVINSIESNAVKKGYEPVSDIDLSELQFAYFMYNRNGVTAGTPLPSLSGLKGDDVIITQGDFLSGGNPEFAALHLATGIGVARESDVPYEWASSRLSLPPEYATDKNVYIVSNAYFASPIIINDVKELLMDYGCATIAYFDDEDNYNISYYNGKESTNYYQTFDTGPNHAVGLVGWDDNYPKENFKYTPNNNGAWLIKNNWGTDFGDEGYFWISYEDTSLDDVVFFDVLKADSFDTVYQYDGSVATFCTVWNDAESGYIKAPKAVNRFTAKDDEIITDVSFVTYNRDVSYKVEILKNGNEVISSQSGILEHCGYHTVHLSKPVNVNKDEVFDVAVSFTAGENTVTMYGDNGLALAIDTSYDNSDWIKMVSKSLPNQGYLYYEDGKVEDVHDDDEGLNLRIKAFGTTAPKISATGLSPGVGVAVRFYVNDSSLVGYHDAYMNAVLNGTEYTLLPAADSKMHRSVFTFKNITLFDVNKTISVKLYATKDGEDKPTFFSDLNYSIKDYRREIGRINFSPTAFRPDKKSGGLRLSFPMFRF